MQTRASIFRSPDRPLETGRRARAAAAGRGARADGGGRRLRVGHPRLRGEWQRPILMGSATKGRRGRGRCIDRSVAEAATGRHHLGPSCGESPRETRRPAACEPARGDPAGTLLSGRMGILLMASGDRMTGTGCLAERGSSRERGTPGRRPDLLRGSGAARLCGTHRRRRSPLRLDARARPERTVVGAGGVGQFVVQGARIAGAARIVCLDPNADRLERAVALGATTVGDPAEAAELLPDGVDVAFDAVGLPDTAALALRHTRSGGQCVLVGMPPAGARLDFDPADFTIREKHLTGSLYGSADPRPCCRNCSTTPRWISPPCLDARWVVSARRSERGVRASIEAARRSSSRRPLQHSPRTRHAGGSAVATAARARKCGAPDGPSLESASEAPAPQDVHVPKWSGRTRARPVVVAMNRITGVTGTRLNSPSS